jgi:hypothetical protein
VGVDVLLGSGVDGSLHCGDWRRGRNG